MFGNWTYLLFECGWAAPVIALQWAAGASVLRERRRILVITVVLASTYLSATDSVAIAQGIWSLHRSKIIGIYLGNVPVEEVVFFLVTNVMVVQSVLLGYALSPSDIFHRIPGRRK